MTTSIVAEMIILYIRRTHILMINMEMERRMQRVVTTYKSLDHCQSNCFDMNSSTGESSVSGGIPTRTRTSNEVPWEYFQVEYLRHSPHLRTLLKGTQIYNTR